MEYVVMLKNTDYDYNKYYYLDKFFKVQDSLCDSCVWKGYTKEQIMNEIQLELDNLKKYNFNFVVIEEF